MAENFAYDVTSAQNIISKVKLSSEFLQVPAHEFKTRDYERVLRKQIAHELHCSTLSEYYKCSRIPRGLRSHLRPTLFSDNPEFCTKFEGILNKCSSDLILLTVEFLQKALEEQTAKIKTIEEQLIATTPVEEWDKIKEKTEKMMTDHRKNIEMFKRQKFLRDAEDYRLNRVYRWQDPQFYGGNRGGRHAYDSSGSGSDTSASSYRSSNNIFLGRGQRRGGRPQGKRGGATGHDPGEQRMWTRSQVSRRT